MIPEDDKGDGSGLLFVGMGTKNVAPFSLLPFLYQRSVVIVIAPVTDPAYGQE
jgi:hypothetical protein